MTGMTRREAIRAGSMVAAAAASGMGLSSKPIKVIYEPEFLYVNFSVPPPILDDLPELDS